jgi:hypothetical protein
MTRRNGYSVLVGNIGTVVSDVSLAEAKATARIYIEQSRTGRGRAGGESVIIQDATGDIVEEFIGALEGGDGIPADPTLLRILRPDLEV